MSDEPTRCTSDDATTRPLGTPSLRAHSSSLGGAARVVGGRVDLSVAPMTTNKA